MVTRQYEPDPRRWKALTVTLVAGFMSLLDVSIVSVALPSIQHGLGATPAGVQWVVSGYALAFGLALVPAGRLGDAIGRRTMFLVALGGFVLFSALAGLAPTE
ncbi:MAG: MFS transporter, partial [Saccharothrix sp.]|nr:MFS transporter [Saccharothrix sp.]